MSPAYPSRDPQKHRHQTRSEDDQPAGEPEGFPAVDRVHPVEEGLPAGSLEAAPVVQHPAAVLVHPDLGFGEPVARLRGAAQADQEHAVVAVRGLDPSRLRLRVSCMGDCKS